MGAALVAFERDVVKLGVLLPTFRDGADDAFAFAAQAARTRASTASSPTTTCGRWVRRRVPRSPPSRCSRAIARRHDGSSSGRSWRASASSGTPHLVEQFSTLDALAPGRVIAALGTGDRLSAAENEAYGVAVRERRRAPGAAGRDGARRCATRCRSGSARGATRPTTSRASSAPTINLWDATPGARRASVGRPATVNWAGPVPEDLFATLDALRDAGRDVGGPRARRRCRDSCDSGVTRTRLSKFRLMEFRRINGLPPYVFATINGLKAEARAAGRDVVDFGFGNPDLPSPDVAVAKLAEAANNPKNHRYSASRGHPQPAPRDGHALQEALRRRPRPRHRGRDDHRRQGGPHAPDVGAARTRRHRHRAEPELPDPPRRSGLRRRDGDHRADARPRRETNDPGDDFFDGLVARVGAAPR